MKNTRQVIKYDIPFILIILLSKNQYKKIYTKLNNYSLYRSSRWFVMPALKCIYEKSLNKGSRGMQRQQVRATRRSRRRVRTAHFSLLDFKWCLLSLAAAENSKPGEVKMLAKIVAAHAHKHTHKHSWSTWLKDDVEWRNRWTSQQEEQSGEGGKRVRAEREIMSPLTATTTTGKEPTRRTSTTSLSCLKQAIGKG